MRKFIIKFLTFSAPVFLLVLVPIVFLSQTHEGFSGIDELVKSGKKYLVGYAYHDSNYRYLKLASVREVDRKTVWALGSSRVLQFRENMFDTSFYNAGYTIRGLNDFIPFLKLIPEDSYPKYLILGLDQWWFNPVRDDLKTEQSPDFWEKSFVLFPKASTYFNVYTDLWNKKYDFGALNQQQGPLKKIGLNAVVNNVGFRHDGSIYYGDQIGRLMNDDPEANDYHFNETFRRVKNGELHLKHGNSINLKAKEVIHDVLRFCKERNIKVVGVLAPFADSVYDSIKKNGKHDYMFQIVPLIKPEFDAAGFELYDFATMASIGSIDKEAIDGMHGGELTYQRMLIKMLESGSVLNEVTTKSRLEADLKNSENNYVVYSY